MNFQRESSNQHFKQSQYKINPINTNEKPNIRSHNTHLHIISKGISRPTIQKSQYKNMSKKTTFMHIQLKTTSINKKKMETNNQSKCVKAELFYQWKGELEWKHRCIDQWMQQQQWIHEQLHVHQKELFFLELLLSLPFWFLQESWASTDTPLAKL
jgi:hypothetical protein